MLDGENDELLTAAVCGPQSSSYSNTEEPYPWPQIFEMLHRVHGPWIFTKLILRHRYHLILVKGGE